MKFYSYPKIPTICKRAEDGTHALTSEFATDSLKVLSSLTWMGTEKIDGTNCGIVWDGHKIGFQGRTEDAAINAKHFAYLQETFQTEEVAQIFEQKFGERPVVLFGELIGGGIQGNIYTDQPAFIAFDLLLTAFGEAREVWADPIFKNEVCEALGVTPSPVVFHGTLNEAIDFVKAAPISETEKCVMEGLVLRPTVELRDNQGKRIFCKVKVKDYLGKKEIKEKNEKIKAMGKPIIETLW